MRKHRILTAAGAAAVVSVAVPVAACAAPGQARSAPTVTVTAAAAPAATATVSQPAPQPTSAAPESAPPDNTAPDNTAPDSTAPGSTAPSAAGSPQIIARFSGSGDQNTGSFTVGDTWHLSWAYWGCPDPQDNFIVSEYNTDGSPDINGVSVNELGSGRGPVATTAYGDGGSHYFQVNTEGCSWELVAVSGQG